MSAKKFDAGKVMCKNHKKWWILASVSICLAMMYIDQSAVVVILPQLHHDFGLTAIGQQWVINSYLLVWTILILVGGKCIDIFGNKRMFIIGLVGFLVASLMSAIAQNGSTLIIGRVLQGAFAAVLAPNTAVAVINAFAPKQRGTAFGIYAGSASIFMTLGPLLGGFFTQFLTWRFIFLINIPLGLVSIIIASVTMSSVSSSNTRESIDWYGFSINCIATTALVFAIMEGGTFGWRSPLIISLFSIAILGYGLFVVIEQKVKAPLLNFAIFKEENYLLCNVMVLCVRICSMVRIFCVLFFQLALGFAPFLSGLLIIPATIPNMIICPLSGKLLDRFGAKIPIILGLIAIIIGLLFIALFATSLNYYKLLLGLILLGIGLPLVGIPSNVVALSAIQQQYRGIASGVYNQTRSFGSVLGFAVIGAIITNLDEHYFKAFKQHALIKTHAIQSLSVNTILARSTQAKHALLTLPKQLSHAIYHAAQLSYAHAFQYGIFAAMLAAFFALCLFVIKFKSQTMFIDASQSEKT